MRRAVEPLHELLDAMAREERWPTRFSTGAVAFESALTRPREVINLADRIMYDVKTHGRNGMRFAIYRDGVLQPDHEPLLAAA